MRRGIRWRICALLSWARTLNYIGRQVLDELAPSLSHAFGRTGVDYSRIVAAFRVPETRIIIPRTWPSASPDA